jgi:hypothetical protein
MLKDLENIKVKFGCMEPDPNDYGSPRKMQLTDCTIEDVPVRDDDEIDKVDIHHLISIITIFKVLVSKGLISRQELLDAEEDAKKYVIKMLNNQYPMDEDRVIMDALHCVPKIYENSNSYIVNIDGSSHLHEYSL